MNTDTAENEVLPSVSPLECGQEESLVMEDPAGAYHFVERLCFCLNMSINMP